MTNDLYIQKDFPTGLGLFIVLVGFAISTVFWYYEMPILTYLVLTDFDRARFLAVLPGARRHDLLSVSLAVSRQGGEPAGPVQAV